MKEILYIEDFGGCGDGVTDNYNAAIAAFDEIKKRGVPAELRFKKDSVYYFGGEDDEVQVNALSIMGINDLSVCGDNTTILCGGVRGYLGVSRTENLTISGFNFDMKTRVHFVGTIVDVDKENLTATVCADRDIQMESFCKIAEKKGHPLFGLHDTGCKLSRIFYYVNTYEWVNKQERLLKISFGPDILGTEYNVKNRLEKGVRLILPTPYIGHFGERSFTFTVNKNTVFENCKVLNAPHFVFGIWEQSGTLLFKNVQVAPPIDETVDFVSWRDCFHCKSNPGKIIWQDCTVRGCNDDIINLSANMMYVAKIYGDREIECFWRETGGGSYGDRNLDGSDVVIWNVETGKLVARTKIEKTVDTVKNRYILKDPLKYLDAGEHVRICIESDIGSGSEIINCDFRGTLRLKCNHTVRNSRLYLLKMWIDYETYLEGPLAKNVLFENTEFFTNTPTEDVYYITCFNKAAPMREEDSYGIENIVFKNCSGLHKKNFYYEGNFIKGSCDEISIID